MNLRKKIILLFTLVVSGVLVFTFWANKTIKEGTQEYIVKDIDKIKSFRAGLLLGTSKTLKSGKNNDYFFYRIDATVALYKKEKIKFIIVSGDNSQEYYNEPLDMKNELINRGVPDSVIYLDYAGFRTFDSVIRAKEIFGQDSIVIISQRFHNERALYIARKNDISAWGYNAKDVDAFKGFKTKLREYFARDKVFIDQLLGIKPKFLGPKINLE